MQSTLDLEGGYAVSMYKDLDSAHPAPNPALFLASLSWALSVVLAKAGNWLGTRHSSIRSVYEYMLLVIPPIRAAYLSSPESNETSLIHEGMSEMPANSESAHSTQQPWHDKLQSSYTDSMRKARAFSELFYAKQCFIKLVRAAVAP
jgi:hypothetical protein